MLSKIWNKWHTGVFIGACKHGDKPQVLKMLQKEPELAYLKDKKGISALFHAVVNGHDRIAAALLNITKQPDDVEPEKGFTPLLFAATNGHTAIVRLLLECGANPNMRNFDGVTALHNAVFEKQIDIVKLLLEHGADPAIQDRFGNTPVDLAQRSANPQLAYEILSYLRKRASYDAKRSSQKAKPKKAEQKTAKPDSEVIVRDETFIAYANGVVYDKKTGLEWFVGPDRETDWYEAKEWVESLNVVGGGWRMPTTEELKTLYQKGVGTRNMTPLLKTTGWRVWSVETGNSSSAWALDLSLVSSLFFDDGIEYPTYRDDTDDGARGFAVRARR